MALVPKIRKFFYRKPRKGARRKDFAHKEIYIVLPELSKMEFEAKRIIGDKKFFSVVGDIMGDKITWIPEGRRVEAAYYVLFKLAGFEIKPEKIRLLGLQGETGFLDKLAENYIERK